MHLRMRMTPVTAWKHCMKKHLKKASYLRGFVPKEVNLIKVLFYVLQTVCLVPALWKDIKADLSPYGKCEPKMAELLPQNVHKLLSAAKTTRI